MDTRTDRSTWLRPGRGRYVTWMSHSRDRWRGSTPGNSVSRTQCRLHAWGAEGERSLEFCALPHSDPNLLCHRYLPPPFSHSSLFGMRIADYGVRVS